MYKIIYADPPWQYKDKGCGSSAESKYPTIDIEKLKSLNVSSICEKDCVLFLWATFPMIQEAFEVIKAWGFTYKTLGFLWIKQSSTRQKFAYGLGRWTRSNAEPCFLAVKGNPKPIDHSISQLVVQPNIKHSTKPFIIREKIVQLIGDVPRIELFARQKVEGWDCWGNEVPCSIDLNFKLK